MLAAVHTASIRVERLSSEAFGAFGNAARMPSGEPLAQSAQFRYWSDAARYHIDGETEIGYCTVFRQDEPRVTWMERHRRTPEILIPVDTAFVLPVMTKEGDVSAFRVEPGEAAVIRQDVWHSACLPADGSSATYFVLFRRGTPREDVEKQEIPAVMLGL